MVITINAENKVEVLKAIREVLLAKPYYNDEGYDAGFSDAIKYLKKELELGDLK